MENKNRTEASGNVLKMSLKSATELPIRSCRLARAGFDAGWYPKCVEGEMSSGRQGFSAKN